LEQSAISRTVTVAAGRFAPGHLGELTQQVPFEMIDAVLAETCTQQRRIRALPARVVVYLLLAGCLFAELGYRQVWHRLIAGLDGVDVANWQGALRRTAHAFRQIALAHPNVVPLLVTRPLAGPLALRPLGTLRPLEELLELFITAGFDHHGALHAARLFTGFLYGHVLHELQERVHDPDETDDLLRLGLHRLPVTRFPRLRSLAAVLAAYDGAAELDEGLAIVLGGLRSQLRRRDPSRRNA
jgi:hypothetical protein